MVKEKLERLSKKSPMKNNKRLKISSLQKIEDSYYQLGFTGKKLKQMLKKDKIYQKLLAAKKQRLTKDKEIRITLLEKKKYILSTDVDFEILESCNQLLARKISKEDREIIGLIKSQLEQDWRKMLIKKLGQLSKKYD